MVPVRLVKMVAVAAVLAALAGCGASEPVAVPAESAGSVDAQVVSGGVLLPPGLTSPSEIVDAIDGYAGNISFDKTGSGEQARILLEVHANGDETMSWSQSVGDPYEERFVAATATRYTNQPGAAWTSATGERTAVDVLFPDADEHTLAATDDGYMLEYSGWVNISFEFVVDDDRVLIEVREDAGFPGTEAGRSSSVTVVSYPQTLPPVAAPEGAVPFQAA